MAIVTVRGAVGVPVGEADVLGPPEGLLPGLSVGLLLELPVGVRGELLVALLVAGPPGVFSAPGSPDAEHPATSAAAARQAPRRWRVRCGRLTAPVWWIIAASAQLSGV
ncbi:MAG TPA: hypothetical protein VK393_09225 [Nocardioidaceae bacterium]|jgi:hypothetical protein|nr:hypothetical protein [Nocardioidaceae bacterium]